MLSIWQGVEVRVLAAGASVIDQERSTFDSVRDPSSSRGTARRAPLYAAGRWPSKLQGLLGLQFVNSVVVPTCRRDLAVENHCISAEAFIPRAAAEPTGEFAS